MSSIKFITGYRYATGLLRAINNMTFFYNPIWEYGAQTKRTLPVAFFHLKAIHEVMESEVQTKKVMFYNSQKETTSDGASGAVLNIIADNIVNKPKSYKLDVIVPYSSLTLLFNSSFFNAEEITEVCSTLTSGNSDNKVANWIASTTPKVSNWIASTTPYVEVMKAIFQALGAINFSSFSSGIKSILETPMANKDSLEYLWKSRTIVKLKSWNSWTYKDVAITNIDITKESTEDGVMEATITCTEVPVMRMRTLDAVKKLKKSYIGLETRMVEGIKWAGKQLYEGMKNASKLSQEEMASFIGED